MPNLHYVHPINDQFAVGGSVTSNFGLATEFNNGYTAGAYGGKTDLQTLNLNLSGAYRPDQHFSFGRALMPSTPKPNWNATPVSCRSCLPVKACKPVN